MLIKSGEVMKRIILIGSMIGGVLIGCEAFAQKQTGSVQQQVMIEVKSITAIRVSGNPNALVVQDAGPDKNYSEVTDKNTTYSVLTNRDNVRIVASINEPMPFGTRLMIGLESSKGVSSGMVDISGALTPITAVAGVGRGSDRNKTITYSFAANGDAGSLGMDSRIVTLTVTD